MSWQQYVDQHMLGTKMVSKGAILSHDGTTWATSAGFQVTPDEGKTLVTAITSDPTPLYAKGFHLNGQKYTFLRQDAGRSVYGRRGGTAGCAVVKTGLGLIIGVYEDGLQGGNCNTVVENLADYLIGQGY